MKTVLHPRSKLFSFRLTGEEYERLRAISIAQGSRCLSDFARAALMRGLEPRTGESSEEGEQGGTGGLERRVEALETTLTILMRQLLHDVPPDDRQREPARRGSGPEPPPSEDSPGTD